MDTVRYECETRRIFARCSWVSPFLSFQTIVDLQSNKPDSGSVKARGMSSVWGTNWGDRRRDRWIRYLLSDDVDIMGCLDLEVAVIGPEIYRVWNTGDTSLVNRLGCFCASNDELLVGVPFPVYEEEREFGEESIVDLSKRGDGLWAGVAIQAALESFDSSNKHVPRLVVIWCSNLSHSQHLTRRAGNGETHHFLVQSLKLRKLGIVKARQVCHLAHMILVGHARLPVVHGGRRT
jgi:hypothetical protein